MIKKIIKLFFILFFIVLIFFFSSDNGEISTGKSQGIVRPICNYLFSDKVSSDTLENIIKYSEIIVRKAAHFTIYFCLGLSVISFVTEFYKLSSKTIVYSLLFVFVYACSDEVHQLFVSGRSGEVLDVIIDTLGGFFSMYLYKLRRIKI